MSPKLSPQKVSAMQGKVFIGQDYRMYSDKLQWVIERRIKPSGPRAKLAEKWVLVGYYPRLQQALDALLEQKMRDAEITELSGLAKLLTMAKQEIKDAASTIEGE